MRPAPKIKGSVLFLFGGSTQEGSLFSASILQEVDFILKEVEGDYQLSNSRRTPDYLTQQLRQKYGTHFMAWQDCPSGWLREQMAVTETVWVTNDSVSMIYEALSAGCRVGLLSYEENRKKTRVSKGIAQLAKDNVVKPFLAFKGMCGRYDGPTMINPFSDEQLKKHPLKAVQFQEADRIAKVMQERGFLPLKQREDGL
jgi:mitochondrial fission protein ELM1